MAGSFNPKRLSLARRRRGLTKGQLAREVSVSLRMVVSYERGDKEPGTATLARLAEALRFPIAFFGGPDLDEVPLKAASFRALSYMTAGRRDQALGSGALALLLSDWIDARFSLPESTVPKIRGVDPETAAVAVRSQWGLGEKPIGNMIHLLEANGVRVFSLVEECRDLDAFSFWRWEGHQPYILLNTMKTAEHSRMDAAHELGHLVLHWSEGAQSREAEREADQFGSAFLMPRGSVLASAPRGGQFNQILKAKHYWKVSAAALTYRMHKLGLLSDWQYRSLFIEMGRTGYRTQEYDGESPESSQLLFKVFKSLREDGVTMFQIATELDILPDELEKMIFGLTLTLVGGEDGEPAFGRERPHLRVV